VQRRRAEPIRVANLVGATPQEHYSKRTRIPGESRDPLFNGSVAGLVDPGFRRECGFFSW